MFTITYGNHDNGATGGTMTRDTQEQAARTEKLMRECGYQTVTVCAN